MVRGATEAKYYLSTRKGKSLKYVSRYITTHYLCDFQVCLHLGNTLWVDPLEIRTKITGRNPIVSDSLTRFLVKREHGIKNIEHMVLMRQLCVNAEMHFENVDD